MKYSRLLVKLQENMSLFSRGNEFEVYLFSWAIYTVFVIGGMWLAVLGVNLALRCKFVAQSEALRTVVLTAKSLLQESAIIVVHLLTISEVTLYATVSFKYVFDNMAILSIDWVRLSLSLVLAFYYLAYILRLIKGCCQIGHNPNELKKSTFNPLRLFTFAFAE